MCKTEEMDHDFLLKNGVEGFPKIGVSYEWTATTIVSLARMMVEARGRKEANVLIRRKQP